MGSVLGTSGDQDPVTMNADGTLNVSGRLLVELARDGTAAEVEAAIARGEPITQENESGMQPLHVAAFYR